MTELNTDLPVVRQWLTGAAAGVAAFIALGLWDISGSGSLIPWVATMSTVGLFAQMTIKKHKTRASLALSFGIAVSLITIAAIVAFNPNLDPNGDPVGDGLGGAFLFGAGVILVGLGLALVVVFFKLARTFRTQSV